MIRHFPSLSFFQKSCLFDEAELDALMAEGQVIDKAD